MSMPVLALLCFGLYLLLGLGVRVALQLWRTGSTGINGYGGGGPIETTAGIGSAVASGVIGLTAPVAVLIGFAEPIDALEVPALQALGLAVSVAGIGLMFYAQVIMGDSWRIGVEPTERTQLVVSGPYALMRNPIYTAWMAAFGGIVLMVPNWIALVGAVELIVCMEVLVRRAEEPYLVETHGAAFLSYASRVGRFVPGVGRLAAPDGRSGNA